MTYRNVVGPGDTYPMLQLEWAPTTRPTAATQTYVDITDRLREWAWSWGRNDELGEFAPGSGYVLLDNRDRALDPGYASSAWNGNIKPRRAFRMKAKVGANVYTVFIAYARGFPQAWPAYGRDAVVRVDLIDQMAFFATFELPVGFSRDVELSGARIAAVLDAINWPTGASYRALSPGTVYVDEITVETAGTPALGHIRDCATAEYGQFFARDGVLVFHDRTVRLGLGLTFFPLYHFSDANGHDGRYDNKFQLQYDDTYLVNKVRVDGPDPTIDTPGTAMGTVGTADYWPITKTIPSQLAILPDRRALAEYEVLRYEQPEYRAPAMTFSLGGQQTDQERKNILNATISDSVTVTRFDGTAAEVELNQVVEGIAHSARPGGPWELTLRTSPADTRTYWTIEDGVYGAIDDPDILIAP